MTEAVCENSIAASVTFTAEIKSFSAGFFRLKRKAFHVSVSPVWELSKT